MTIKEIKSKVLAFRNEFDLKSTDYNSLKNAGNKSGYTVIEYNHIFNDSDTQTIIENLNISENILRTKGFTYADSNYRLIFIHEDLTDAEKVLVLSHELGHIYLGHLSSQPIIGKDVKDEYEANEFSHYLLNGYKNQNIIKLFKRNKKNVIIAGTILVAIIIAIMGLSHIEKQKSYYGEYYITTTGNKYHEKECIFVKNKINTHRMTKEEFESGDYEACDICLPHFNQ